MAMKIVYRNSPEVEEENAKILQQFKDIFWNNLSQYVSYYDKWELFYKKSDKIFSEDMDAVIKVLMWEFPNWSMYYIDSTNIEEWKIFTFDEIEMEDEKTKKLLPDNIKEDFYEKYHHMWTQDYE